MFYSPQLAVHIPVFTFFLHSFSILTPFLIHPFWSLLDPFLLYSILTPSWINPYSIFSPSLLPLSTPSLHNYSLLSPCLFLNYSILQGRPRLNAFWFILCSFLFFHLHSTHNPVLNFFLFEKILLSICSALQIILWGVYWQRNLKLPE